MACGLQLRVDKYLEGTEIPSNGVMANVYALGPNKQTNSKRSLVIPVGDGQSYSTVNLEPGNYLVEAILPSGDIISDEKTVNEGEWPKVDLRAEHSAHEWHSWHNLVGSVESHSSYYRTYNASKHGQSLQVWTIKKWPPNLQIGSAIDRNQWELLGEQPESLPRRLLGVSPPSSAVLMSTGDYDDETAAYSFLIGAGGLPKNALPRWFALVQSNTAASLATIPSPWFDLNTGLELEAKLLIRQRAEEGIEAAFSLIDSHIGTALGYMARGALQSALQILSHDRALDMLFNKWDNPLGAAAGAYVLIGTKTSTDQRHWHEWVSNLMNNFPWLPDGAIQRAWLLLAQASSDEHLIQAREALITAYDRGLPYYSLGLQWMIDGLTLLGEEDAKAKQMLSRVQKVAWRADMSHPFTTITLKR